MYWNLPGFGFNELTVNHINTFFKSKQRLAKILLSNLLQECIVLPSAKLQISHFKRKKKSLMKIFLKSGPIIDPWGGPQIILKGGFFSRKQTSDFTIIQYPGVGVKQLYVTSELRIKLFCFFTYHGMNFHRCEKKIFIFQLY